MATGAAQRANAQGWMDLIRLAAAVEVVLYHLFYNGLSSGAVGPGAGPLASLLKLVTGFGAEAVLVFFVLSGFWIAESVDRLQDRADFWPVYLARRGSRLLAVLVPALLIGGALDWLGSDVLSLMLYRNDLSVGWGTWGDPATSLRHTVLIENLLFLQEFAAPPLGSNVALWSISYEFWFYLYYPAYLLAVRGRPALALLTVPMMVIFPKIAAFFPWWLAGAAVYHLAGRQGCNAGRAAGLAATGLAAGIAVVIVALRSGLGPDERAGWVHALIAGAALAALVQWAPPLPRMLAPLARLGATMSFSLYATHLPLIVMFGALALATGLADTLALRLAALVGAFGWGWAFSRLFEARTEALRRALLRRVPGVVPAAVPAGAAYRH